VFPAGFKVSANSYEMFPASFDVSEVRKGIAQPTPAKKIANLLLHRGEFAEIIPENPKIGGIRVQTFTLNILKIFEIMRI
jgi:hypothetical protein